MTLEEDYSCSSQELKFADSFNSRGLFPQAVLSIPWKVTNFFFKIMWSVSKRIQDPLSCLIVKSPA